VEDEVAEKGVARGEAPAGGVGGAGGGNSAEGVGVDTAHVGGFVEPVGLVSLDNAEGVDPQVGRF